MQAIPILKDQVPRLWHEVKPLIDKALVHNHGEMIAEDVLEKLLEQRMVLWIGVEDKEIKSALVAEVHEFPRKKVLHILTWATKSGHDYLLWMDLFDAIEDFGRANGCSQITAWTRKGLAKKLKWTNEYSVVTKDL